MKIPPATPGGSFFLGTSLPARPIRPAADALCSLAEDQDSCSVTGQEHKNPTAVWRWDKLLTAWYPVTGRPSAFTTRVRSALAVGPADSRPVAGDNALRSQAEVPDFCSVTQYDAKHPPAIGGGIIFCRHLVTGRPSASIAAVRSVIGRRPCRLRRGRR